MRIPLRAILMGIIAVAVVLIIVDEPITPRLIFGAALGCAIAMAIIGAADWAWRRWVIGRRRHHPNRRPM